MVRRSLLVGLVISSIACGEDSAQEETVPSFATREQHLELSPYQAANTSNATNPDTSADMPIYLMAGSTVMIATCVVTGSSYVDDTYLRLFSPTAVEVASNDDYCSGLGSKIHYTAATTGNYMIRAGCFSTGSCQGTVAYSTRKGLYTVPTLSNTNNANVNTYNKQYYFNGGDTVRVSTCTYNAYGASATGDTYLRLFQQINGQFTTQVAENNNTTSTATCANAAEIVYNIPSSGYYQIRAGCSTNTSCSGNVAVYVE